MPTMAPRGPNEKILVMRPGMLGTAGAGDPDPRGGFSLGRAPISEGHRHRGQEHLRAEPDDPQLRGVSGAFLAGTDAAGAQRGAVPEGRVRFLRLRGARDAGRYGAALQALRLQL